MTITRVTCTFENQTSITSSLKDTFEEVEAYYLGNVFDLGEKYGSKQKCTKVELVAYYSLLEQ
ncbi:hypothetical protein bcgnr5372_38710 [Bacillus luti]|nr:hypothetical protein [Bacillus cereus]HDR8330704.1 hypothetical protein [Bacillus cereus]HDR8336441.1 hypothetical protein [Bacillus cereus]